MFDEFLAPTAEQKPLYCAAMDATNLQPPTGQPPWRQAIDNWWVLLLVLFFVTAAVGLPLLWMSRGFSTASKWFWSVAVIAWTVLVLWLFWLIMVWSYTRIADALGV